jgi:molecular chaperone GrpE (heat shock protein)
MSQLNQLKQQLQQVASQSQQTAANIQQFEQKFTRSISEVQALIGGTATNADKQIIDVLQNASRAVKSAAEALRVAASTAQKFASQA